MKVSLALESPLLFVLDDAIDRAACELIIAAASRKAPQIIEVVDEASGTSTRKRKFPVAEVDERRSTAEVASLQAVLDLVQDLLHCPPTAQETQPNLHCTDPSAGTGLTLGLHVDTNLKPQRFATVLLYLRDAPAGGGGETLFPLSGIQSKPHPLALDHLLALDADHLINGGCSHTRRAPEALASSAARMCRAAVNLAASRARTADDLKDSLWCGGGEIKPRWLDSVGETRTATSGARSACAPRGVGEGGGTAFKGGTIVRPRAGRVVVFFTRLDNGDVDRQSWHGGADSTDPQGKWTLQFFKEVPLTCVDMPAYVRQRRDALAARFAVRA